ncbi:MAG: glycoside hydrolase family 99-like domain-containing protein [Victivallales bacterium]|nr:glycoside hydrolase family 99-like domain-containing protein [Victivallales bacterium]
MPRSPHTEIAVFYFPNYHPDRRNALVHGDGWTEWNLVRQARPRFPGHVQPRVPLWGYEDESSPEVMARKMACAAKHGIDTMIFDWYWYEDGPFLDGALERGLLPAAGENPPVHFALMWANHDWLDIHPWRLGSPRRLLYPGRLSDDAFERMTDYLIEHYFRHPAYWTIDGQPFFSIYSLPMLRNPKRLERLQEKTKLAGFPGVHLNLILQDLAVLPDETGATSQAMPEGMVRSLTSYIWLHHCRLKDFPRSSYNDVRQEYFRIYAEIQQRSRLPYFPNVTVGWDSSPRTAQDTPFPPNSPYPYTPIMPGSPESFKEALVQALANSPRVLTINAWNEWTEGSYLEPDLQNGYAYLEALKAAVDGNKP